MITSTLFYIFVVVAFIQIIYYLTFCVFTFSSDNNRRTAKKKPISVILCAKNKAEDLLEFLPSIIHQKYPDFEIVLINNASIDNTLEVMEEFQKKHKNIKVINVENIEAFWGNKKYALTLGIKAAKNQHLLFTEANCKIASKYWISKINNHFTLKKNIILGYGKYEYKKYSFLNLFIRFETLLTAIQYFSSVKLGFPYTAAGRNLAYTKAEFFKVKGFINHMHIPLGEDDLFIQDAATKINTTSCFSKNSFTIAKAPKTFKSWFQQKRIKISTSKYYKFSHQFFIHLFFLSKLLFIVLAFILFFLFDWRVILSILLIYYLIQFIVIGFSAKKLEEKHILFFLPFLDIFSVIIQFSIFIANSISKPVHWK